MAIRLDFDGRAIRSLSAVWLSVWCGRALAVVFRGAGGAGATTVLVAGDRGCLPPAGAVHCDDAPLLGAASGGDSAEVPTGGSGALEFGGNVGGGVEIGTCVDVVVGVAIGADGDTGTVVVVDGVGSDDAGGGEVEDGGAAGGTVNNSYDDTAGTDTFPAASTASTDNTYVPSANPAKLTDTGDTHPAHPDTTPAGPDTSQRPDVPPGRPKDHDGERELPGETGTEEKLGAAGGTV